MIRLWHSLSMSRSLLMRIQNLLRPHQTLWTRSSVPTHQYPTSTTQQRDRPLASVIYRQRLPHTQLAKTFSEILSIPRHSTTPLPRISLRVRLRIPAQSPRLIRTTPTRAAQVLLLRFPMQKRMMHMKCFAQPSGKKLEVETRCSTSHKGGNGTARWKPRTKRGLSPLHRQGGNRPHHPDIPVMYLSIN